MADASNTRPEPLEPDVSKFVDDYGTSLPVDLRRE